MRQFISFIASVLLFHSFLLAQQFDHFITAEGSHLMEGEKEFRFLSFNIPNLNYVEDEMSFTSVNPYGLPNEYEIRDAFESIQQLGGRVVRLYTIPVRNHNAPANAVTYVEGPGQFNEKAFENLDLVLALANEYGIRVIFPLLNNWQWMGGVPNYAEFRGLAKEAFWIDSVLIQDFKTTVDFVLNRKNSITGVTYKEDKAILCWETGNELQAPAEWTLEICRYLQEQDPNHLVMDGYHAIDALPIQEYSIEDPAIDIITSHHYEADPFDMMANIRRKVAQVGGRKPYILGEIGFISTSGMTALLDQIITNPTIAGALTWSLRYHHRDGGFYWHSEPVGLGLYKAYHWPGFNSGHAYDERNFLHMWRKKAFEIQNVPCPPIEAPASPKLLPIAGPHAISWQGASGAQAYDLYRATDPNGPWQLIGYQISDAAIQNFPLFHDRTALLQTAYYYRATASNQGGISPPSEVVGPFIFDRQAIVDNLENLGCLFSSVDIVIETGEDRTYKEIVKRACGEAGSNIVYHVPGSFLSATIYAFDRHATPQLVLEGSEDGITYEVLETEVGNYPIGENLYDYDVPKQYRVISPGNWRFIQLTFNGRACVGRVEIEYDTEEEMHPHSGR